MTSPAQEPPISREFVKQSSLYQEFLAEREEILKHKWLESERLGYDIGFERALLDWIRKHREGWRAARRQHAPPGGSTRSVRHRFGGKTESLRFTVPRRSRPESAI
jgi:hypothetical protein